MEKLHFSVILSLNWSKQAKSTEFCIKMVIKWPKMVKILQKNFFMFFGPNTLAFFQNLIFNDSLIKMAKLLPRFGLKKPFLRDFKPKPKSTFFPLPETDHFQDQFLILHSSMGNDGIPMKLIGGLVHQ